MGGLGGISWFQNVSKAELEYLSVLDSHNSFVIFIGTIIIIIFFKLAKIIKPLFVYRVVQS